MTGWLGTTHKKPSDIMMDVLEGKLHHDDAPKAVQSMCRLQYYHAAVEILSLPENKMRKALQRVPSTCRHKVREVMVEMYNERK